jgi:hypothetical protein
MQLSYVFSRSLQQLLNNFFLLTFLNFSISRSDLKLQEQQKMRKKFCDLMKNLLNRKILPRAEKPKVKRLHKVENFDIKDLSQETSF